MDFSIKIMTTIVCWSAFSTTTTAQDSDKIKSVAIEACECSYKISVDLDTDAINEEINSCITTSILAAQMKNVMGNLEEEIAGATETDSTKNKNIVIYADENFEEIQAYMLKNCPAIAHLLATDNVELNNSMSKNSKAVAFYNEGQTYFQQENYTAALVAFNKAVEKDSKFAFAWDNLGITYRKLGNYKQAIKCYDESLKLDPKGRVPLMSKGVAFVLLNDLKSAIQAYKEFIKRHPEDPEGYYGISRIQLTTEDYDNGLENIFKAYTIYSNTKSAYLTHAEEVLSVYYNHYKNTGKLEKFNKIAAANNININAE